MTREQMIDEAVRRIMPTSITRLDAQSREPDHGVRAWARQHAAEVRAEFRHIQSEARSYEIAVTCAVASAMSSVLPIVALQSILLPLA